MTSELLVTFLSFIDVPDRCSISSNTIKIEMNDGEGIEIPGRNSTLALTFNRLSSGRIPIYAYGSADGYANPMNPYETNTVIPVRMVNASASEVEI